MDWVHRPRRAIARRIVCNVPGTTCSSELLWNHALKVAARLHVFARHDPVEPVPDGWNW